MPVGVFSFQGDTLNYTNTVTVVVERVCLIHFIINLVCSNK